MKGKRYTTEEKIRMLRQADEGAREGERTVKTDAGGQDAGDRDPAGDPGKKTVSPGHKRQVAERLVARGQCSMRAGWRYFQLHRSTYA